MFNLDELLEDKSGRDGFTVMLGAVARIVPNGRVANVDELFSCARDVPALAQFLKARIPDRREKNKPVVVHVKHDEWEDVSENLAPILSCLDDWEEIDLPLTEKNQIATLTEKLLEVASARYCGGELDVNNPALRKAVGVKNQIFEIFCTKKI